MQIALIREIETYLIDIFREEIRFSFECSDLSKKFDKHLAQCIIIQKPILESFWILSMCEEAIKELSDRTRIEPSVRIRAESDNRIDRIIDSLICDVWVFWGRFESITNLWFSFGVDNFFFTTSEYRSERFSGKVTDIEFWICFFCEERSVEFSTEKCDILSIPDRINIWCENEILKTERGKLRENRVRKCDIVRLEDEIERNEASNRSQDRKLSNKCFKTFFMDRYNDTDIIFRDESCFFLVKKESIRDYRKFHRTIDFPDRFDSFDEFFPSQKRFSSEKFHLIIIFERIFFEKSSHVEMGLLGIIDIDKTIVTTEITSLRYIEFERLLHDSIRWSYEAKME